MPNGDQMNSEMEFMEHFSRRSTEQKLDWIAKEQFHQANTLNDIACKQGAISDKVRGIEQTCNSRALNCPAMPKRRIDRRWAYGGLGTLGGGGILYCLVELVKTILERGG